MAEINSAQEPPPCPPIDNGDRLDRQPIRLDETVQEQTPRKPGKRKMSEKQLETLRKAREAKAIKSKMREASAPHPHHEDVAQESEHVTKPEEVSPTDHEEDKKEVLPPKVTKSKVKATKPKSKVVVPTYTLPNVEIFNVF